MQNVNNRGSWEETKGIDENSLLSVQFFYKSKPAPKKKKSLLIIFNQSMLISQSSREEESGLVLCLISKHHFTLTLFLTRFQNKTRLNSV